MSFYGKNGIDVNLDLYDLSYEEYLEAKKLEEECCQENMAKQKKNVIFDY